ncbi:MAG: hypothetical protein B6U78_00135 [Candidatus Aenigmarchaeota archaeon ex4484_224]|nr:MAG: hypothetical protein B6U78_00135 [Candidatus Aenigmarchaeota archaeon ex4484_224]
MKIEKIIDLIIVFIAILAGKFSSVLQDFYLKILIPILIFVGILAILKLTKQKIRIFDLAFSFFGIWFLVWILFINV